MENKIQNSDLSAIKDASLNESSLNSSGSISHSQVASFKSRAKIKKIQSISEENIESISNGNISILMKNLIENIELINKQLWSLFAEKQIILSEFIRRRRKQADAGLQECDKRMSNHDGILMIDKCKIYNQFLNAFVKSVEIDNSLIMNILADAIQQSNYLSEIKLIIENESANEILEDSLNGYDEMEETTKISLIDEIKMQSKLLERVLLLNPENRSQITESLKISNEYFMNNLQTKYDELSEECQLLKHTIFIQIKLIAELNHETFRLTNCIDEIKASESNTAQANFVCLPSDKMNSIAEIEPLSRVCNKYTDEYKKCLKSLEKLIEKANDISTTSKLNDSSIITDGSLNNSSTSVEEDLYSIVEICTSTEELLTSYSNENNKLNIEKVQTDETDETSHINPESKISMSLQNVEMIKSKVQHILAQLICHETNV